jgi:chromate transporter
VDYKAAQPGLTPPPTVPLSSLAASFLRLGATSFGGGTTGWTYREIVERRGWISEEGFVQALTIAQVMPGANAVNLAVYLGMQMRGWAGASVAGFGMVTPAFVLILVLAGVYSQLHGYPQAKIVLTGLACVGMATTLAAGVKLAYRLKRQVVQIAIAVAIFLAVGILGWPLVPVVVVVIPVSVVAAYLLERRRHHG